MVTTQIIIVMLGALAGGFVSGLSGFGTGITAMGIWLYVISPPVAASLVIICSIISRLPELTLPMVWHAIQWKSVWPYIAPGLIGVPVGTVLLSRIDPNLFKICIGLFLVVYAIYALTRRPFRHIYGVSDKVHFWTTTERFIDCLLVEPENARLENQKRNQIVVGPGGSNLQPSGYEPLALTIELRARAATPQQASAMPGRAML